MKYFLCLMSFLSLCTWSLYGCEDSQRLNDNSLPELSSRKLPIINGTRVTGDDRLSTVVLVISAGGRSDAFCTGTLITPNYVLTAGHCIYHCQEDKKEDYIEAYRPYMRVGIGQSDQEIKKNYEIESFIPHPQFYCSKYDIRHDIALLKLKTPVPLSVAVPTLPMPQSLDITASDVDSANGVSVTTVGFGRTSATQYSTGIKYETTRNIYAWCPLLRTNSKKCTGNPYTQTQGFIYFQFNGSGTCEGDSGGPTFLTRGNSEYVIGVTSYGFGECNSWDAVTLVSDNYDFINQYVTDLGSPDPENCSNNIDDNGDGLIDCYDPHCFNLKRCIPEDCDNGKDDNGNGLFDCDDPQCFDALICQPEICDNALDDNGNGLIDCNDPQCFDAIICQPEDCSNNIDDNGNGLIDCKDPLCINELICQPEICNNNIDDNGNGLRDCDDPQCSLSPFCLPEICNNLYDDNGDNLIDCADPQCISARNCQPENCFNKIDDNDNGLVDCEDPQCNIYVQCQPEICNDQIDNNADGLIDCFDPQCISDPICTPPAEDSGSCASSPNRNPSFPALCLMIMGLVLIRLRRRLD